MNVSGPGELWPGSARLQSAVIRHPFHFQHPASRRLLSRARPLSLLLSSIPAPSEGARCTLAPGRRHRLPRCRHTVCPSPQTVQAPSLAGHGLTALGPRPIPWLSRPCVESRAARLTIFPVYGLIRYRTPPALCPEDLSIWRNGSSVLASPAMAPAWVPGPYPVTPRAVLVGWMPTCLLCPPMALGIGLARVRLVLFPCCGGMLSRNVPVLDVLGVVGDWHAGRVVE